MGISKDGQANFGHEKVMDYGFIPLLFQCKMNR